LGVALNIGTTRVLSYDSFETVSAALTGIRNKGPPPETVTSNTNKAFIKLKHIYVVGKPVCHSNI